MYFDYIWNIDCLHDVDNRKIYMARPIAKIYFLY